jgi:phage host-nuclease inhibitor protein Gam
MGFNGELKALVDGVADRVDRWTAQAVWTFEPGSSASAETANTETRLDGTPWGDRPVRTAYAYAQMAAKLAVEFSRCAALVIGASRPAPGIETETRSALEAGSVAWWLLEPGLTARQRVCRMQLLRRNSAREFARSISEVGEDPAVAGSETIAGIEAECCALGLSPFTQGGDRLEGQMRLGYTARVRALTDELGNQGAYSIYSGSAHAELTGIWRLLGQTGATLPDRQPLYGPVAASPAVSLAAAGSALKALMGPAERIALLSGWTVPGRGEGKSLSIASAPVVRTGRSSRR